MAGCHRQFWRGGGDDLSVVASSRPKLSSPQSNCKNSSNSTLKLLISKCLAPRFLTVRLTQTDKMCNIDFLFSPKSLGSSGGNAKKTLRLSKSMFSWKPNFSDPCTVEVERHAYLKPSCAVVTTDFLGGITDEVFQSAVSDQSISKACQVDGRPLLLRTMFLTVDIPTFPSIIHVGYERVVVRPSVPNWIRCLDVKGLGIHRNGSRAAKSRCIPLIPSLSGIQGSFPWV